MPTPEQAPIKHSPQAPAVERRTRPRLEVIRKHLLSVKLGDRNGGVVLEIAESRMTVQAVAPLAVGTRWPIEIQLPIAAPPVAGTAEVLSSRQKIANLQVQFLPESHVRLQRWLEYNRLVKPRPVENLPLPPLGSSTSRQVVQAVRLYEAPSVAARRRRYTPLAVCAVVSVAIALAFGVFENFRAHSSADTPAVQTEAQSPTLTPAALDLPSTSPAVAPVENVDEGVRKPASAPVATTEKRPRIVRPQTQDEPDEPEVVVRRYVDGHWLVVKQSGR